MSDTDRNTVLVIFPGTMMPVHGGGAQRTWAMVDDLRRRGYRVELVTSSYQDADDESKVEARVDKLWVQQRAAKKSAAKLPPPNGPVSKFGGTKSHAKKLLKQALAKLVKLGPVAEPSSSAPQPTLSAKRLRGLEDLAQRAAYATQPIAAIAHFAWIAHTLDRMPPGTLRILDTHDIQHTRAENAEAAGGDLSDRACTREEEIRELKRADVLLAIQPLELEVLSAMCPDKPIVLVQHAHVLPEQASYSSSDYVLLTVGNLYDPNVLGLKQFLEYTWPKIRAAVPRSRLHVCGRICEAFRQPVSGVSFEGLVPDLTPYYNDAAVVLNPVAYGSGLKVKSVEALAYGKCLVCTEAGTLGLGNPKNLPLIVADVTDNMADEIIKILRNMELRRDYEARAREYAKEWFDPDRIYGGLAEILQHHVAGPEHRQDSTN